jgi:hypothetical protein
MATPRLKARWPTSRRCNSYSAISQVQNPTGPLTASVELPTTERKGAPRSSQGVPHAGQSLLVGPAPVGHAAAVRRRPGILPVRPASPLAAVKRLFALRTSWEWGQRAALVTWAGAGLQCAAAAGLEPGGSGYYGHVKPRRVPQRRRRRRVRRRAPGGQPPADGVGARDGERRHWERTNGVAETHAGVMRERADACGGGDASPGRGGRGAALTSGVESSRGTKNPYSAIVTLGISGGRFPSTLW